MAISPEVRPKVSEKPDYDTTPDMRTSSSRRPDRMESNSNNSMGVVIGILALLVAAYFLFAYYGQNPVPSSITNQSTTTVAPSTEAPVPPATPVAPSATPDVPLATPSVPPATSETPPAAPVEPPATPPATPPASSTTP